MKISVYDSDGVFRGGLLRSGRFAECRTWFAPPHPHFLEYLGDISGYGEPTYEGCWFIIHRSRNPVITGSKECDDEFDEASYATKVTSLEALNWFKGKIYDPPEDLVLMAKEYVKSNGASANREGEEKQEIQMPLSEALQEIWDLLEGKALLGKELARLVAGGPVSQDSIRKRIVAIRTTGRSIVNKRPFGYYRPDAPPEELKDVNVSPD